MANFLNKQQATTNGTKPVTEHSKKSIALGKLKSTVRASINNSNKILIHVTGNGKIDCSPDELKKNDDGTLINFTNDLCWSVDTDFKLITANNAFIKNLHQILGVTIKTGDDLLIKGIFPDKYLAFWEQRYKKALSGKCFKEEIFAPTFNKRESSWSETSFNPMYESGIIVGVTCFSRNITDRKLAEEKLRRSEALLAEAQRLAKLGSWNYDIKTGRFTWSDELYNVFGTNKQDFNETHASFTELVDEADRAFVLETSNHAQETGKPFKITYHITTPKGEKRIIQEHGYGETDAAGKVIRLFGTAQDITESKKADEAIKRAFEDKNTILERIDDGFFALDKNSIVTYWNKRAEILLNVKREDMIGKNLHEVFASTASGAFYDNYQKAIRENTTVHFTEFSARTGKWFAVSAYASDNGLSVYFKDVTEQKTADEKIRESEAKYRTLFEQNMAGIYQTTAGGTIITCNNAFAKMLKYNSPEELIKINTTELYFSDAERNDFINNVTTRQNINNYESVLKCKDGSPLHIIENISVRKNDITGEDIFNGIMIDITEKKQAELQLKESNDRYNLICKATNDMVWDWDLVTGKVYRNKEGWKKIFRTGDREIKNELIEDWDNKLHPQDRNKVKAVQDKIKKSGKDFFEVECRMLRDDGTYAYIHDRGNIIRDEHGKAIRLIGATQDITPRKEAELQVVKSELRFRSLVQKSSDPICIFDHKGYFKYSSPAIKQILGFEAEDTIGKNIFAFVHPDDITALKNHLSQTKKTLSYQEMPLLRFKNISEEWRWIESKVTNMTDNSEVNGYVFNCRDITERILLEKQLEREKLLKHQEITKAVISAQEEERQELGRELHDNVNQILAGSLLYLGMAKRDLNIDHPYLKETDALINAAIEEIRSLSHLLIPPSLHESEFLDALENIIDATQKTSGILISLQACGFDESSIPDKLKLTIYRIVQEQINNILKHAAAEKVIVHLVKDNERTLLSIKDDGVGFDTSEKTNGVGLLNIKTRASLFNGDIAIISSPGKGCELRVLFN